MKKITILLLLLFVFISCSKNDLTDSNINSIDNTFEEINNDIDIDDIDNQVSIEDYKDDDFKKDIEIKDDKPIYDKQKQKELNEKLDRFVVGTEIEYIDCFVEFPIDSSNNKKDQKFIQEMQKRCNEEKEKFNKAKQNRIKERIEAVANFSIEKCEEIAKEKYAYMKDMKKEDLEDMRFWWEDFSYESMVASETEFCEQAYAFQYGCELLLDDKKRQKCIEMKEFQKKLMDLERYQNFILWNYLK